MRRFIRIYLKLISIQIRSQMQYRLSFWLEVFSTAILNGSAFFSTALVLERFQNIAGWTLWEIAFLTGMIETAFGTMDMIFSGFDPSRFSPMIRRGGFDQLLLRPMNITLQVFSSDFVIRRIGRIFQGLVILGLAISQLHFHWTPLKMAYLPVVFLCQVFCMGSLFIFGSTITFWTVERIEAVNILTYGGVETMSYPITVYPNWMQKFFTFVVPFIFLNYSPALFFLDKPDPLHLPAFAPFLAPAAALVIFFAALRFWNFGIQHYQSTGT